MCLKWNFICYNTSNLICGLPLICPLQCKMHAHGKIWLGWKFPEFISTPAAVHAGYASRPCGFINISLHFYFKYLHTSNFQTFLYAFTHVTFKYIKFISRVVCFSHVLGPMHFISWIEAKYKPSTHQELCYLNFELTKWVQEKIAKIAKMIL